MGDGYIGRHERQPRPDSGLAPGPADIPVGTDPPAMRGGRARRRAQRPMNPMNSARVRVEVSKLPRMALVMVELLCFWTPRIIMHV